MSLVKHNLSATTAMGITFTYSSLGFFAVM
jgi:hypothetical protein